MKKAQIVKLLPQAKELNKSLKTAIKEANKLEDTINKLETQVLALEGVTLYNGFPVRVNLKQGEIWSGCDDVVRYATVNYEGENEYSVFGYFTPTESVDLGLFPKKVALSLAQHFVATGKKSLPKSKADSAVAAEGETPKKRGRPKKSAA